MSYSWRRLWRTPVFTLTAILTLGLGVGVNATLFSVVNGFLYKALPVQNLDRLVAVSSVYRYSGETRGWLSEEELRAFSSNPASGLRDFVVHDALTGALAGNGQAKKMNGEFVSGNYFNVLGVRPLAGRLLNPSDDLDTGSTPAVISEHLWRDWFASSPHAIGRPLTLDALPLTIVGIVPDTFRGTWMPSILAAQIWVPTWAQRNITSSRRTNGHRVLAVLRDGESLAHATVAVETIGRGLPPREGPALRYAVLPGRDGMVPDEFDRYGRAIGIALLLLSGCVFLIACANIANLMLARYTIRIGELAIRTSLGARRSALYGLLMTETLLLIGLSTGVAYALITVTTRLLARLPPPELEGIFVRFDPAPDVSVLIFAFAAATMAAMVVGVFPARRATSVAPARVLAASGGWHGTRVHQRLQRRLTMGQMAVSVLLVTAAALYGRGAIAALHFDPGYDTADRLVASVEVSQQQVAALDGQHYFERLLGAARGTAGSQGAALTSTLPGDRAPWHSLTLPGGVNGPGGAGRRYEAQSYAVSPGLFSTLALPLRGGRDFTARDTQSTEQVVIMGEHLAAALWPKQEAIGRQVMLGDTHLRVIGVVGALRARRGGVKPMAFYRPYAQEYSPSMQVVVRSKDTSGTMRDQLRQRLHAVDTTIPVFDVKTLVTASSFGVLPLGVIAVTLSVLAVLGLVIALIGVYGVMTYLVSQSTRDFGIQAALGASRTDILSGVLWKGARMLTVGATLGTVAALMIATAFRASMPIFAVPLDPLVIAAVPLVLTFVGVTACLLPARRAARVLPAIVLRDL